MHFMDFLKKKNKYFEKLFLSYQNYTTEIVYQREVFLSEKFLEVCVYIHTRTLPDNFTINTK